MPLRRQQVALLRVVKRSSCWYSVCLLWLHAQAADAGKALWLLVHALLPCVLHSGDGCEFRYALVQRETGMTTGQTFCVGFCRTMALAPEVRAMTLPICPSVTQVCLSFEGTMAPSENPHTLLSGSLFGQREGSRPIKTCRAGVGTSLAGLVPRTTHWEADATFRS